MSGTVCTPLVCTIDYLHVAQRPCRPSNGAAHTQRRGSSPPQLWSSFMWAQWAEKFWVQNSRSQTETVLPVSCKKEPRSSQSAPGSLRSYWCCRRGVVSFSLFHVLSAILIFQVLLVPIESFAGDFSVTFIKKNNLGLWLNSPKSLFLHTSSWPLQVKKRYEREFIGKAETTVVLGETERSKTRSHHYVKYGGYKCHGSAVVELKCWENGKSLLNRNTDRSNVSVPGCTTLIMYARQGCVCAVGHHSNLIILWPSISFK